MMIFVSALIGLSLLSVPFLLGQSNSTSKFFVPDYDLGTDTKEVGKKVS